MADGVLVSFLVYAPLGALLEVVGVKFPVFGGVVEAGLQAPGLFLFGDMQEKFQDHGAVVGQQRFEIINVLVAALPDFLVNLAVHAGDEYVFVVGAVEHPNVPPFGGLRPNAPEKILAQLVLRRRFEGSNAHARRIHPREQVLDGAVLAARVHGLKDEQHVAPLLRVEPLLQLAQPLAQVQEARAGVALVVGAVGKRSNAIRGHLLQAKGFALHLNGGSFGQVEFHGESRIRYDFRQCAAALISRGCNAY